MANKGAEVDNPDRIDSAIIVERMSFYTDTEIFLTHCKVIGKKDEESNK
ncbi:MAG: hypothetical protein QNJ32_10665 [Xenococcaceae cyanobacterium MO_167.B27]|nr:hypothetical protein [Xenococcaceae cyanobacterium MO_167.B27]